MSRVYLLIHIGCLCLLGEVLTSPHANIGSGVGRFIGISRHPWVLVNPRDIWARRSARFAAKAILDPRYSIYVHIISARAMNPMFGRYEYYDLVFFVNYILGSDKFICRARIHWKPNAHLEHGLLRNRCDPY
ncbi:uncharacterized protein LOC132756891 [Ruditapes philippinarum]|uniref:uncharacterized protein LOC132756891 n=1 Tax=Ruditapes philippinarum TaxID=129788 RepID=UPI00295C12B1|nr:uncharacterized protein LOC132756891 [Ruditapes philippinarum]